MSILTKLFRSSVRIEADRSLIVPGHGAPTSVICPRCERPIEGLHECKAGMSRRMFGVGLFGATAAALTARLDGVPLPTARVQVIVNGGDAFEVDTDRAFMMAFEKAVSKRGNPFKDEAGVLSEGGLLEFHPLDFKGDNWLRVYPGVGQMNVLGLRDKESGKPIKYRIVRNQEVERQISATLALSEPKPVDRPVIRQIPTDSKHVSREGGRKATFQSALGEFQIQYKAGKTKDWDLVTWQFMGLALPSVVAGDHWAKPKTRPVKCTGSLHTAIETLNVEYPEVAFKVRQVIMRLNPEARRRSAAIRQTKKVVQA